MRRVETGRQGGKGTRRYSFAIFVLFIIIIAGCGESPFEPDDSAPSEIPGSLTALDFPTADGSTWEYVSLEDDYSYTAMIDGTKNIALITSERISSSIRSRLVICRAVSL